MAWTWLNRKATQKAWGLPVQKECLLLLLLVVVSSFCVKLKASSSNKQPSAIQQTRSL
jgi:hypothetical protein